MEKALARERSWPRARAGGATQGALHAAGAALQGRDPRGSWANLRAVPVDSTERASSPARHTEGTALHPILYLVLECARPLAGSARVSLAGVDEVVLGRGATRKITRARRDERTVVRVDVPDKRMSTDHARLVLGGGGAVLEDLASTNGTLLDGEPVAQAPLRSGKAIEVGQTIFLYSEIEERPGWTTTDLASPGGSLDGARATAPTGLVTLDPIHSVGLERLKRVAVSPVAVMLLGESGTGKEVLARAVHEVSKRPGPFVAVNCGAIPANLVESQLFGHTKGAFSGAVRDEPGLVRSAQYGTLFLDEIGDLPAASQAALLRVLQEGEVTPVGAARAAKVDVRVVCATHQPLDALMDRGVFRRDLYARLAGFTHLLPPLRERRADIGLLVAAILRSPKARDGAALRLNVDVARALLAYDWPLNIRELEQCIVTGTVLAEGDVLRLKDLPAAVVEATPASAAASALDDEEAAGRDAAIRRELLLRLADCHGNVSEVARAMGKARQQVQRWIKRFGLDPEAFRARE